MSFQYQQPSSEESTGSGTFVDKPGIYHVIVMDQNPNPTNYNKTEYISGLEIVFGVIGGANADQIDKTFSMIFKNGKPENADGGEFLNRRLFKFFQATGLKETLEPGKPASLDTAQLLQPPRQLVIELELRPNSPKAKNPNGHHLELKFDNTWHVDDPAVKDAPKNMAAIAQIPASLRRDPSTFKVPDAAAKPGAATEPAKPRISPSALLAAPVAAAVASPAPSAAPVDVSAI